MKKNDWLDIANKKLNMGLDETSKVKDIMKKISDNLGLNDVPITKLEKTILEKTKDIPVSINEQEYKPEPEPIQQEEQPVKNEVSYSEIDLLRAECTMYGVGYGEKHTTNDLTQLLNAIKGAGVQPTMTLEQALNGFGVELEVKDEAPSNGDFEITLDNINEIQSKAPSITQIDDKNVSIQLQTKKIEVPVETIKSSLEVYRDSFNSTINNHFRLLSENELRDMFTAQYPFTTQFNYNPKSENQIEVLITQHGITIRIPSEDKNQWVNLR